MNSSNQSGEVRQIKTPLDQTGMNGKIPEWNGGRSKSLDQSG